MSKFLDKHPKLAIAFDGARRGLKMNGPIGYGIGTFALTGFVASVGLAGGAVLIPVAAGALAGHAAFNASAGAAAFLRYEKKKARGDYGRNLKPSKIPYPLKKPKQ
jgi:hypothetical protein